MMPVEITEDEFVSRFRPIANHLNRHASCFWNDGDGSMFETYGDELEYVRSQPFENVWTYIEADGGSFLVSGYRLINRLGYFITEEAVPDGMAFEVNLEGDDDALD